MSPQNRNIITGIVILAVLVGGYFLYNNFTNAPPPLIISDSSQQAGQDILNLLASFQTISIDPAVFGSPLFQNLKDYTIILPQESQGRLNPFAPIGQ